MLFVGSTNLFEFKVRVASISDGSDNVCWLVRSELVILVESHVTILFNAEINIHLILETLHNIIELFYVSPQIIFNVGV